MLHGEQRKAPARGIILLWDCRKDLMKSRSVVSPRIEQISPASMQVESRISVGRRHTRTARYRVGKFSASGDRRTGTSAIKQESDERSGHAMVRVKQHIGLLKFWTLMIANVAVILVLYFGK